MSYLVDVSRLEGSLRSGETKDAVAGKPELIKGGLIPITGASEITRMLAKTIAATMRKLKDTDFFKSEDEAVKWLKEEQNDS